MNQKTTLASSIQSISGSGPTALLEQYVRTLQKNEKGHYSYLTPKHLSAESAEKFEKGMDKQFAHFSAIQRELTGFLRKSVDKSKAPGNWKQTTSRDATLIAANLIPLAAHIETPLHNGRITPPDALLDIADTMVPQTLSPDTSGLNLLLCSPRNELSIVEAVLFELSAQAADELEVLAETLQYGERTKLYRSYLDSGMRSALHNLTYTWEATSSIATLRNLMAGEQSVSAQIQEVTPRYGYAVPKIIEQADLVKPYQKAFDASYELFSTMQQLGEPAVAELCVLLGHQIRFRYHHTGANVPLLIKQASNPDSNLQNEMVTRIAEVHPILIEALQQRM